MIKKRRNIIPPTDIILDLINDEPYIDVRVLDFYEAYILSVAKEPKYTASGEFICFEVNEDLAQELRIALFRSLPKLHLAFFGKFGNKPIVVTVSQK